MKRKTVMLTPPLLPSKKGKVITVQLVNDILVLNFFRDQNTGNTVLHEHADTRV